MVIGNIMEPHGNEAIVWECPRWWYFFRYWSGDGY